MPNAATVPSPPVARGTAAYRRLNAALFLAGFATFSLLYCVQPLLPSFAAAFARTPAESSLALSLSTGLLAPAILAAAMLSERWGRRRPMLFSMVAAASLNVLVACAPNWPVLLALRAAEGVALGGVPAVAMAFVAEEVAPEALGAAMGLYLGGTAFGGMAGRVAVGMLVELLYWRAALAVIGAAGLLAALGFAWLAPPENRRRPRRALSLRGNLRAWAAHLRHPALSALFAIGFLAMGAFVSIYNYAGFRLGAPPYRLGQTALGLIFTVYLFGIASSSAGGVMADRFGAARVLAAGLVVEATGVLATLARPLAAIIAGVALLTVGFFAAHAVASGWVGRLARQDKGHASSLYLLAYYLGSSLAGSAGGWFLGQGGWQLLVAFTVALLGAALVAARVATVRAGR